MTSSTPPLNAAASSDYFRGERERYARPLVAIVGRPNVGKSSLFNAIIGRQTAIVSKIAGTTRDRLVAQVEHFGIAMLVVDTGGLVPEPEDEMEEHIAAQVDAAVDGADVVVLVTDVRDGTPSVWKAWDEIAHNLVYNNYLSTWPIGTSTAFLLGFPKCLTQRSRQIMTTGVPSSTTTTTSVCMAATRTSSGTTR